MLTKTSEQMVGLARGVVRSAEADLGPLNNGQRTDLLLDYFIEDLRSVAQARALLREAGLWTEGEEICQRCGTIFDFLNGGTWTGDPHGRREYVCLACGENSK